MIKSLDKFKSIEKGMKKAFLIMIVIDVLIYITRLIFLISDITIRYFDDLTEIMRNGFLLLGLLYLFLHVNYVKYFKDEEEAKLSNYIKMIFIILGYILISFILFAIIGLMVTSMI